MVHVHREDSAIEESHCRQVGATGLEAFERGDFQDRNCNEDIGEEDNKKRAKPNKNSCQEKNQLTDEGIRARQGNDLRHITEEMVNDIWPTVVEIKTNNYLNKAAKETTPVDTSNHPPAKAWGMMAEYCRGLLMATYLS